MVSLNSVPVELWRKIIGYTLNNYNEMSYEDYKSTRALIQVVNESFSSKIFDPKIPLSSNVKTKENNHFLYSGNLSERDKSKMEFIDELYISDFDKMNDHKYCTSDRFALFKSCTKIVIQYTKRVYHLLEAITEANMQSLETITIYRGDMKKIIIPKTLEKLVLSECNDLEDISEMENTKLKEIKIEQCDKLNDIKPIHNLHVTKLTLIRTKVDFLHNMNLCKAPILKHIRELYTSDCVNISWGVSDNSNFKTNISSLPSLRSLSIDFDNNADALKDLPITGQIEKLNIYGRDILDLEFLPQFPNLTSLSLSLCERILDFSPIVSCKNLEEFSMSYIYRIQALPHIIVYLNSLLKLKKITLRADVNNMCSLHSKCGAYKTIDTRNECTCSSKTSITKEEYLFDLKKIMIFEIFPELIKLHLRTKCEIICSCHTVTGWDHDFAELNINKDTIRLIPPKIDKDLINLTTKFCEIFCKS